MRSSLIFLFTLILGCSSPEESGLSSILETGSTEFQEILTDPKHEIQIIYGKIEHDSIRHETHNVDPTKFFYPASTVKMPVAFAALQRLNELGYSLDTKVLVDSSKHNPRKLVYDSLFKQELTVRNLITKIFTVSDNQAYNILYGWLGKDYINKLNQRVGLSSSRIIHQLSESAFSFSAESNRNTFKITLIDEESTVDLQSISNSFYPNFTPKNQIRGLGYMNDEGEIVNQQFDFSQKNFIALADLLGTLERVIKPGLFQEDQRYVFDQDSYKALEEIMLLRPRDLPTPLDTLKDSYVKFFMYGDSEEEQYPEHIQIRNKVGWAYGYLTDVAYVHDTQRDIEFFLAATIHVNENQIYNDGEYQYEEVGLPFLAELGRLVYAYEIVNK